MAATKANQKVIEKEVDELIECITGFSPEVSLVLIWSNVCYSEVLIFVSDLFIFSPQKSVQMIKSKCQNHLLEAFVAYQWTSNVRKLQLASGKLLSNVCHSEEVVVF